jgi:hypothetical protein
VSLDKLDSTMHVEALRNDVEIYLSADCKSLQYVRTTTITYPGTVSWEPWEGRHRLQVFEDDILEFTSYHDSEDLAQIFGNRVDHAVFYTHKVQLEDFLCKLQECVHLETDVDEEEGSASD